ncbi:MAG: calcium/sodium antiporter [Clostridiales bacterium]|nr:calcium/sodium antiporter [Clostridiales bacterium]
MIWKAVLLFIVGLVCLIKGGDWFVDASTGLAKRFRVPEILIGATIVSIGTTLPEVMVSATSAFSGHSEIAYGNAIGSIICNTALISAVTIAIRPSKIEKKTLTTPVLFFFISAVFYSVIAYTSGNFSRIIGIALLAIFVVYMVITVLQAKKSSASAQLLGANGEVEVVEEATEDSETEGKKQLFKDSLFKDIIFLIIGAALIAVGARLLVNNGTIIATGLGVPESVIALTFVALGTSLPELVTAITALVKGHSDLSLGNIVGANLFNLVLVSGVSVAVRPFSIPVSKTLMGYNSSLVLDIPLMLVVMGILTVPSLIKGKLSRWQGILLLLIYAAFCAVQFAF